MAEVGPVPWKTIPDMLRDVAQRHAGREAVVDRGVCLDFAALRVEAQRVGRALRGLGIGPGDRVAVWSSNRWQWVVAACGVWELRATLVPVASRWKAAEVVPLLQRTDARLLLAESRAAGEPLLGPLAARCGSGEGGRPLGALPALEHIVVFDELGKDDPDAMSWEVFTAGGDAPGALDVGDPGADRLAQILFTSGTTAAPKGVELRERQLLQSYWDWSGIGGLRAGDRFLVIPPYSHGFGINGGILSCLMRGVTNLPMAVFDPQSTLDLVAKQRVSVMSGPPTLFATLMNLEGFDPAAVSSLRLAFVGAAAVPTELIRRMRERMGIERVCNAYGMIEACVISMTRADDAEEVVAGTAGRPLPGVEVRVVDEAGAEVQTGEPGEIWVRSAGVMRAYWRDPEQTAAAIMPEGWQRTGDVGELDAAGQLRIVDRLKDAYNCGGFSVYPAETESRLLECEDLAEVAVVGVPDERLGEVGHAFVVAVAGQRVSEAAVISWSRENMANYRVPRRVTVLDALPLNANGKVRKDVLRARAIQERGGFRA